jgi:hypothetical protein
MKKIIIGLFSMLTITSFAQSELTILSNKVQNGEVINVKEFTAPINRYLKNVDATTLQSTSQFFNCFTKGLSVSLSASTNSTISSNEQAAAMEIFNSHLPANLNTLIKNNDAKGVNPSYIELQNAINNATTFEELQAALAALFSKTESADDKRLFYIVSTALQISNDAIIAQPKSQGGDFNKALACDGWWKCWGKCAAGILGGIGGGGLAGAGVGSTVPGLGTVVGGVIGGIAGGLTGASQACP